MCSDATIRGRHLLVQLWFHIISLAKDPHSSSKHEMNLRQKISQHPHPFTPPPHRWWEEMLKRRIATPSNGQHFRSVTRQTNITRLTIKSVHTVDCVQYVLSWDVLLLYSKWQAILQFQCMAVHAKLSFLASLYCFTCFLFYLSTARSLNIWCTLLSLTPWYDAHQRVFEKFGALNFTVFCTLWSLTTHWKVHQGAWLCSVMHTTESYYLKNIRSVNCSKSWIGTK